MGLLDALMPVLIDALTRALQSQLPALIGASAGALTGGAPGDCRSGSAQGRVDLQELHIARQAKTVYCNGDTNRFIRRWHLDNDKSQDDEIEVHAEKHDAQNARGQMKSEL